MRFTALELDIAGHLTSQPLEGAKLAALTGTDPDSLHARAAPDCFSTRRAPFRNI
jgi:hypothetical protein